MDESERHAYSSRNPTQGDAAVPLNTGTVKLTDLASCGGCAAKYSAARLERLLAGFVPAEAQDLLVGLAPADDAAVYRLDDERALIFTLDFFPPVVDDPGDYGAIAATNALNDVFAMGGTPLLALSIAAFPEDLPVEMLAAIFAAADAQVRAAGGLLAGGHTIRDDEPKYGLAVVGTVHPQGIWPKNGARSGDVLFLTKPLGTGLIMTGYKRGQAGSQQLERAIRWMRTLNDEAAQVLRGLEPSAVTDVTGFGLFGHAHEVAERSGVRVRLESARFPAIDGALDVAREGVRTSGDPRNRDFAARHVELAADVPETMVALGYDPQTAGGLLVSVAAERGPALEAEFEARKLFIRRIGHVEEGAGVVVE
jgi:selenide, water dikinase